VDFMKGVMRQAEAFLSIFRYFCLNWHFVGLQKKEYLLRDNKKFFKILQPSGGCW
jgi:hypothetical protein